MKYTHLRKQHIKYELSKIDVRHVSRECFNALTAMFGIESLLGGKIDHNKLRKFLTEIPTWRTEFTEMGSKRIVLYRDHTELEAE